MGRTSDERWSGIKKATESACEMDVCVEHLAKLSSKKQSFMEEISFWLYLGGDSAQLLSTLRASPRLSLYYCRISSPGIHALELPRGALSALILDDTRFQTGYR